MDNRSHTTRSQCAGWAWHTWAAIALLWVGGCQSNNERDLVARDRRFQEDQLYAMQDYISQYQQLVCRFRAENDSLRRQLVERQSSVPAEREPQPMPRTPATQPKSNDGPNIDVPPIPGTDGKQPSTTPKLDSPAVPPLKQSTLHDGLMGQGTVQAASYEPPLSITNSATNRVDTTQTKEGSDGGIKAASEQALDVLLSGEVVENNNGGGPRLLVDVEPFNQSGRMPQLDGNVSLMLLESDDRGRRSLGRWDFGPDEVRAAIDRTANEPTMRFPIELPAGTPVGNATELWVRLVPTSGGKVLSHAKLDLSRPGVFSSRTSRVWPSEESVVTTSYDEPQPPVQEDTPPPVNEGTWAIAQPGVPANLPSKPEQPGSGWRATNEPLPVADGSPVAPSRDDRPALSESQPPGHGRPDVARRTDWSPERPGKSTRSGRPVWSATR